MYQTHRIFCATPWEMEKERRRFYDIIGSFNENKAMKHGVLYVPVTITNIADKRPVQYVIDENIMDSRHYILVLGEDGWGPAARNFRHDYRLATESVNDPASAMESVAVLGKIPEPGADLPDRPESLPQPEAMFETGEEFDRCVNRLLERWLELSVERKSAAEAVSGG